jgi:hypothetical protein
MAPFYVLRKHTAFSGPQAGAGVVMIVTDWLP